MGAPTVGNRTQLGLTTVRGSPVTSVRFGLSTDKRQPRGYVVLGVDRDRPKSPTKWQVTSVRLGCFRPCIRGSPWEPFPTDLTDGGLTPRGANWRCYYRGCLAVFAVHCYPSRRFPIRGYWIKLHRECAPRRTRSAPRRAPRWRGTDPVAWTGMGPRSAFCRTPVRAQAAGATPPTGPPGPMGTRSEGEQRASLTRLKSMNLLRW